MGVKTMKVYGTVYCYYFTAPPGLRPSSPGRGLASWEVMRTDGDDLERKRNPDEEIAARKFLRGKKNPMREEIRPAIRNYFFGGRGSE